MSEIESANRGIYSSVAQDMLDNCSDLKDVFFYVISKSLGRHTTRIEEPLKESFYHLVEHNETAIDTMICDALAITSRDPACIGVSSAVLFYKGLHALVTHRVAHHLWGIGENFFARELNTISASALSVDIHPAAKIGNGIFIDHATGVVVGETTVMGNNISMFHGVTLGGTGKNSSRNRHPVVEDDVLLSSHCSVLGNITVGRGSRVAASSVVLNDVPPFSTVVGIPAKVSRMHERTENNQTIWNFDLESETSHISVALLKK